MWIVITYQEVGPLTEQFLCMFPGLLFLLFAVEKYVFGNIIIWKKQNEFYS